MRVNKISGTGTVLLKAIEQSVARPLAPNTIRLLSAASTTAGTLFPRSLSAPDILLRNVNAAGSMAGVAHAGDSQSPFFILSVDSYGETFADMFSWEPRMPRDLKALFSALSAKSSAGTTTTATSTPITQPEFRDEVVSNHDVRIYAMPRRRNVLLMVIGIKRRSLSRATRKRLPKYSSGSGRLVHSAKSSAIILA